jgi:hypothetical protein
VLAEPRDPATLTGMPRVHIEHVYHCSESVFWQLFFNDEFNQRLFKEGLGFPQYEQLSFEETAEEIRRVTSVRPRVGQLPGPLKKVVGEGIGYREHGVFDKRTRRFSLHVVANKMPDRLTVEGVLFTEPLDQDRCRRLFDAAVQARVFGVGKLLENRLIADLQANYSDSADFTNRYLAQPAS